MRMVSQVNLHRLTSRWAVHAVGGQSDRLGTGWSSHPRTPTTVVYGATGRDKQLLQDCS